MMWLLCTDIATIVFWAAFLNTLFESIVKEEKIPEVSFSSLHDLAYSKGGNTKGILKFYEIIELFNYRNHSVHQNRQHSRSHHRTLFHWRCIVDHT
jgi:hypothetical protein